MHGDGLPLGNDSLAQTASRGRISKIGDAAVRTALYEAAHNADQAAQGRRTAQKLGDADRTDGPE